MSQMNPFRFLERTYKNVSLRRRLISLIIPPLFVGMLSVGLIARVHSGNTELRLVSQQQQQIAQSTASQITVFMRSLPQSMFTLTNSTSLQAMLNITRRAGDIPDLAHQPPDGTSLLRERNQNLTDLTYETYQMVLRNPAIEGVSIYGRNGAEIVRAERFQDENLVRMARTPEMGNVERTLYFEDLLGLGPNELRYSAIEITPSGQPVLYITTPVFIATEQAGGLTITVDASAFLQYVTQSAESSSKRIVLLDSDGRYMADSADQGNPADPEYAGPLFNLNSRPDDPQVDAGFAEPISGLVQNNIVVSSFAFEPFNFPIDGTPWTLVILESTATAFQNVRNFGGALALTTFIISGLVILSLWIMSRYLIRPLNEAAEVADQIARGDLSARITIEGENEIGRLSRSINSMTTRLLANLAQVEERFTERTRDLEVAAEIANIAVGMDNAELLLQRAVDLIRERFSFYHVQAFMVDDRRKNANLVASTGEPGKKLLDLQWSLPVGSGSVIGQVTDGGDTVIALDTKDAVVVHRPNPHLPDTRSEMALPMRYGNTVIGALDIQSTYSNAFSDEDVRIFEVLANQLAIAVSNTRQLEETNRQMTRVQELNRRLTRQAWDEFLAEEPELVSYMTQADPAEAAPGSIKTPIAVQGEIIGTLETTPEDDTPLTDDEIALVQAVAERVSLAVENARLVTQTQHSLMETERLYQSAQIINSESSLGEILNTLNQYFGIPGRVISVTLFSQEKDADGVPLQIRILSVGIDGSTTLHEEESAFVGGPPVFALMSEQRVYDSPASIANNLPAPVARELLDRDTQAMLSIPMVGGGQVLGRLMLRHSAPYSFNEREIEIMESLAGQLATVIFNRQLFQDMETERQTLKSVLDTMPTAVMVMDAQTEQATLSNDRALMLLGEGASLSQLAKEERLYRTDTAELFPLDEIPAFQALQSGTPSYSEELSIRLPDGGAINVMSNAAPIFDAAGNVSAVVTVFQDISELRELQNALQETLRETTALYESSRSIYASEGLEAIAESTLLHLGINASPDEALVLLNPDPENPESALQVLAAGPGSVPAVLPYPRHLFQVGRNVNLPDVATSGDLSEAERTAMLAANVSTLATIPMAVGGETVGWVVMVHHTPVEFAPEEWRYVESLADQAAVSIQNARLRQQTEESLQETSLLYETSSLLVDVNNVQGVLEAIVQHAAASDLANAQLYMLQNERAWDHPDASVLLSASWSDDTMPDLTGTFFTADQHPNWQELKTDFILAIDDIAAAPQLDDISRTGFMSVGLQSVTIIPLVIGDKPAGAIQLGYTTPHAHTERELRIYQNLAELTTIALQNIDLLDQTQHRARQLQTSAEVSRAVTSILNVEELLPRIVNLIRSAFNYDNVQVFLLDEMGENAVLQASTGEAGETMLRVNWSLPVGSNSVIGQVTERAEPVIALDTADADIVHRPNPYLPDTRSEMAIPLRSRGRVVGAVDVQSRQPSAFVDEDVDMLTALGDQIAVALDNARLFAQTQDYTLALSEQVLSLQTMLEASQRFASLQSTDEILQAATEEIVNLMRVDHAGILLATPQDPSIGTLVADYPPVDSLRGIQLPIEGAWWRDNYEQSQQPVVVDSVADSPLLDEAARTALMSGNIKQVVIVPFITSGGNVVGSIGLDVLEDPREFTREDLTLLQLFATQVASAYQNAQSFANTQRQAEEMRFLFNVTSAATEASELEASMETMIAQLKDAIPTTAIGVYLTGEDPDYLERIASFANAPDVTIAERIANSSWAVQQAIEGRKPFMLPDLNALDTHHGIQVTNLNSMIATPLFAGNDVIGLIALFERDAHTYTEGNLRLLQALSGSISAVVQNIRLLEEVQAANDRLRELDKIKSQFLANMSHELRTPLNSIIGFSRVILKGIDGPLNDMQTQDLETIHSSGQHLLNLINDILDQAKIEADKLSINVDWFDLNSVVEVARSMSIGLLKDKPVRLNVEIETDLPRTWGDEMRTRQVLLNLLSNAAKFTYEGSITVAAFTVHREDGPYIQVAVSDTGVGIPENKLGSVFVAFEQVDGSLTRTSGGTGLGLPISKSLIEMMGGELWVESTINVGSTFSFMIPAFTKSTVETEAQDPETDPMAAQAQVPFDQQAVPDRKIVLVIDGEVGMHQLYRSYLNKVGYTVEATANANQAPDIITVIQPDMIIMDMRINDGQGWNIMEWLASNEETARIPVIVSSLDPDEARARDLGAVAYLPKPFLPNDMVQLVQQVDTNYIPERLLIIDDKPETMRLIMETLRQQPRYLLQTATSGQQGLSMIAQRRPDLVLLDLNMPEIDGIEVLHQLRSNPRTQHIPVLILTAETDLAEQQRDQLENIDIYSKNPEEQGQLLTGVSALLTDNQGSKSHSNGDNAA